MSSIDNSDSDYPILIWLDLQMADPPNTVVEVYNKLKSDYDIQLYDNFIHCINEVISITQTERDIFLIVSSSIDEYQIKSISDIPGVVKTYTYCTSVEQSLRSVNVSKVCYDMDTLLCQLKVDTQHYLRKPIRSMLIFTKQNTFNNLRKSIKSRVNFEPIRFKLIIETLLKITLNTYQLKQEFLNEIRSRPGDISIKEQWIIKFEKEYNSDKAIEWYTRDGPLYRIINQGFRTENIDIMFQYRFFFVDLYNSLQSLHKKQQNELEHISELYRGQLMSTEEFSLLQDLKGSMIIANSFWSTTKDREVAHRYSANGEHRPEKESIVYRIRLDRDVIKRGTQPFAYVTPFSSFKDEDEYLFVMGSVFRLEKIEPEGERQIIVLSLTDGPDALFNQYIEYYRKKIDEADRTLQTLVSILIEFGQGKVAQKYLQASLLEEDVPTERLINNPVIADLIQQISTNCTEFLTISELLHQISNHPPIVAIHSDSSTQKQLLPQIIENMKYRAMKFYYLGLVNYDLRKYNEALINFDLALDTIFSQDRSFFVGSEPNYLQLIDQHVTHSILAKVYFHIALVHFPFALYSIVISVLSKAYAHCKNALSKNESNYQDCELLVGIYYLFGRTYYRLVQYRSGIAYYRKALRACSKYQISPIALIVNEIALNFAGACLVGNDHNKTATKCLNDICNSIVTFVIPQIEYVVDLLSKALDYYQSLSDKEKSEDLISTFRQTGNKTCPGHELIERYYEQARQSINDKAYYIAMESFLQLIKVGRRDPFVYAFTGWAYYKQNRVDKALFYLQEALRLQGNLNRK
ncbi:unnamed protein product [Rotaria socialis]|uniref:Uncharacterized protein n=1 Tax=Rotaria socialis TaxID=392032 RepID=A0A818UBR3_9BILA|nr:unnamed protein product [Rotaria socialis]CAF4864396.1 unnamed protein product [Rotaria socialis]